LVISTTCGTISPVLDTRTVEGDVTLELVAEIGFETFGALTGVVFLMHRGSTVTLPIVPIPQFVPVVY